MDWITLPLLPALGSALLHSLWQFTLLAGLAFLASKQTNKAALRHNIYLTTLLLFPFLFGLTFWLALPQNLATSLVINTTLPAANVVTSEVAKPEVVPLWSWLSDHLLEIMAMIYLFGLVVLGIRSGRDWWQIRRLRQTASTPTEDLAATYAQLKTQMPTLSDYPLRISSRVNSALTVGIFRPFILLPIGLINALSPAEVEAILLHEMAHLFRKDHLWNALQTLITQIFFYHPMVHWLRIQLDREREYACDDLVTGQINRELYAQSLLKVARLSITHKNQFIMQAQGKSHFTQRVQRLFLPPTSPQSRRWWLLPALLLPCLFTVVLSAQQSPEPVQEPATETVQGPMFGNPNTTLYFLNGDRYDNYAEFVDELQTDTYTQICDTNDEELQRINAEEGGNYEMVVRFYTGEDRSKAMEEQGINAQSVNVRGAVNRTTAIEAETISIEGDKITQDEDLPNALTIDGVVVHHETAPDAPQLQLKGEAITYYDQDETETQERSAQDGVKYGGLIEVETVKPNSGEQPDPVGAIVDPRDSVLILVNGTELERGEINAINPETIESINVIKGDKIPAKYQGLYNGIIEIKLKKGVSMDEIESTDANGIKLITDEGTFFSADDKPAKLSIEITDEILIFIDDKEASKEEHDALDPDMIKHIKVIQSKKKLKKMGYKRYKGVVKIYTKDKAKD